MATSAPRNKSQSLKIAGEDAGSELAAPSTGVVLQTRIEEDTPVLPSKFQVVKLLGEGGMGRVFEVQDLELGSTFAVKVMNRDWLGDDAALQCFRTEASAAGELIHPHIVQVYECSTEDPTPYIRMEYVEGISFDRVLKRERIVEQGRLLNMVVQICDALEYAHLHGVVHRDLKPSNIILQDAGDIVKLVDFGIAKVGPKNESVTQMTQKGEVFGSPMYMSPEQAAAAPVDHRTDLYSLGCTLYEALAGKPLFSGENAVHVLLQHMNTSAKSATRKLLKKGYSRSLVAILEKLLEKQPDKRYQSAAELADDIRRILRGQLSFALLKKPFLVDISGKAVVMSFMAAGFLGVVGLSAYTTLMVAHLESSRDSKTNIYDQMVSRRAEARDLTNKIVHGDPKDMFLSARALHALVEQETQNSMSLRGYMLDEHAALKSAELLCPEDQQSILGTYQRCPNQETKVELLSALCCVNSPIPQLVTLACSLSGSTDRETKRLATAGIVNWSTGLPKDQQKEVSTALSALLLEEKDRIKPANGMINDCVVTALDNISQFSNQAMQNIRQSARDTFKDTPIESGGWNDAQHPLVHIAKISHQYFPELTSLLNSRNFCNQTLSVLQELGPKAQAAVPDLCKLLTRVQTYQKPNVWAALAAIGPSAAPRAVPVLSREFQRSRGDDAGRIALTLAKMGPSGMAVLRKQADLPRSQETPQNQGVNDPIDAAQEALADEKR